MTWWVGLNWSVGDTGVIHGKWSRMWLKVIAVCEHDHKFRQTDVLIYFFVHRSPYEKACVCCPFCCCFHAFLHPAPLVWWGRWAAWKHCQTVGLTEEICWPGCTFKEQWEHRIHLLQASISALRTHCDAIFATSLRYEDFGNCVVGFFLMEKLCRLLASTKMYSVW